MDKSLLDSALSLVAKTKAYAKSESARHPEALVRSDAPLGRAAAPLAKVPEALIKAARPSMGVGAGPDPQAPYADNLEAFQAQICQCQRCPLGATRKNFVFGEGATDARVVFVGDAPGEKEDSAGRPFVGPPGQLLDKIISAMDLKRAQVYLLNAVKCRPPLNRDPAQAEIAACAPYLQQQLALIKPRLIVALGEQATRSLLGPEASVANARGRFSDYEGIKVMATYHPAAVLRDDNLKRPVWDDMKLVVAQLRAMK